MRNDLEKRLSRLEKRAAERIEKPKVCNCRVRTSYHERGGFEHPGQCVTGFNVDEGEVSVIRRQHEMK